MDDDTMINPDDIGSAEELRDLLMGLGFADTRISDGVHISTYVAYNQRFQGCLVRFRGKTVMITVLNENEVWFDYEYIWPMDEGYWTANHEGVENLRGPFTAQTLIDRIYHANQLALDAAAQRSQR